MDPDANLTETRELVRSLQTEEDKGCPYDQYDVQRLLLLVAALDEWMSKGGFLPLEWSKLRK